ncbi:hypothetical protein B0I31_10254 [Saccharothrix carnea]|uniref:Uncharacterized protein n=1 Tax=Saccharothrix carnea TaxID=1280637 RepID=A0A2P8IF42_SACCR|nr:hypothetical protein B0I31_10254 [Saccharothrix carnea]
MFDSAVPRVHPRAMDRSGRSNRFQSTVSWRLREPARDSSHGWFACKRLLFGSLASIGRVERQHPVTTGYPAEGDVDRGGRSSKLGPRSANVLTFDCLRLCSAPRSADASTPGGSGHTGSRDRPTGVAGGADGRSVRLPRGPGLASGGARTDPARKEAKRDSVGEIDARLVRVRPGFRLAGPPVGRLYAAIRSLPALPNVVAGCATTACPDRMCSRRRSERRKARPRQCTFTALPPRPCSHSIKGDRMTAYGTGRPTHPRRGRT